MKYYIIAIIILITAFIILFNTKTLPGEWENYTDQIESDFRGYKYLEDLCLNIGGRIAGSEEAKETEKFIIGLLESFGYNDIFLHPFEHIAWNRIKCSLNILDKNNNVLHSVNALALGLTPESTNIKLQLVDLMSGTMEDYKKYSQEFLSNKIVLVDKKSPIGHTIVHRVDKVKFAQKKGVQGIIIFNQVYGNVLSVGTASFEHNSNIPAVSITREDGLQLKEIIQENEIVFAELQVKNEEHMTISNNIIAEISGGQNKDEIVMMFAHLDAWDVGQGAVDNGANVAILLELARQFKKLNIKPNRTVQFIFFNAEEFGLIGSKRFIQDNKTLVDRIVYAANLEMNISPNGINLLFDDRDRKWFENLSEKLSVLGMQKKVITAPWLESDHCYFMLNGIPTITFTEKTDIFAKHKYHSSGDDLDLINPEDLKNCVKLLGIVLQELANTSEIQKWRLTEKELKTKITNSGLDKIIALREL